MPQNSAWRSVTYGNGLFVAVSRVGTQRVMTSPDGITWASRTTPVNQGWTSVTYGSAARSGNGLFVAVSGDGSGNRVMTSPDGITWSSQASAANLLWLGVTYGNGLFVAVGTLGSATQRVMTSPDGMTWALRTNPGNNTWRSVAYGAGTFVAVADTGTNRMLTSSNGITWAASAAPEDAGQWLSVVYANGVFVAVSTTAPNRVMISNTVQSQWTLRATAASGSCQVTATKAADGSYLASTSAPISVQLSIMPSDPSTYPVAAMQQFAVPDGTTPVECAALEPSSAQWPGLTAFTGLGWTVSYAEWPNDRTGGWVCSRQPLYTSRGWEFT